MGETFYSVLEVDADADAETVRRTYRALVKEHHPDVSDDPGASERFKRLTTARDVLVDEDERARYERLGHRTYVRRHLESGVWSVDEGDTGGTTTETTADTGGATAAGTTTGATGSGAGGTWPGRDERIGATSPPTDERRRARRHTMGGPNWQQASQAYRRAETDVSAGNQSLFGTLIEGSRELGPWLFVHVVFVLSAMATAWITISQSGGFVDLSVPALLFSVLIVSLVTFLSMLHIVSHVYS